MVKVLDREAINRMVGGRSSITGSGGGSDFNPDAYANRSWVDDYYVGKSFLSSMAKAYDANGNEIKPNDVASTIANINITKTLVLSKVQDASGSADNGPALIVGGTSSQAHIEIDSNEIMAKANGTSVATLYLNDEGGEVHTGGDFVANGGDITIREPNSSNSAVLHFKSGNTETGNLRVKPSNNELYFYTGSGDSTPGCMNADWFYAYTQVTALSDERKKNIIGEVKLSVEDIAKAPAVKFLWKDKRTEKIQVGSIAQYWQKILPESIAEKDGYLTMSYSVISLLSSITLAQKVVEQDKIIKAYEKKISNLEARLSRLEKMFAITNDLEEY